MPTDFGSVLAHYLRQHAMIPAELARRSGVSADAVEAYLKNSREPGLTAFRKLCRGLDVSVDEFIGRLPPLKTVKYKPAKPRGRPRKVLKGIDVA